MAHRREIVVIGAGHNGLVTAALLARAGQKPLVLEARATVGGRAVTEEIAPGFRCSTVLHAAGPLLPKLMRDLELERHGLTWLRPDVRLFAPSLEGKFLCIHDDAERTAADLASFSPRDADGYRAFAATFARMGAALSPLLTTTPPSTEVLSGHDLWSLVRFGRRVRGLGKRDAYRLLRWAPMPVADLVEEWFEHPLLRASIAARGIYASFAGPRSAGTSASVLLQAAMDGHASAPAAFPRGGMGALTSALAAAARRFGAEIRTDARVARIEIKNGAATGVVLASGEEIAARVVVSDADPRHTLLGLVDAAELGPEFVAKMRHYRSRGTAAKLNLALSRLPRFSALGDESALLTGRIHIGRSIDDLERAFDAVKYGELSERPVLDIAIPTALDPSLAPAGAHAMSIHVQFVPYVQSESDRTAQRSAVLKTVVHTLAAYAPDLPDLIVGHQVLLPVDLEDQYGLSGGHLLHGEPALDQLFTFRPLLGCAQYRTPIRGLYLCGSGTHPGGVVSGASGLNASREILKDLRS
ncbi:MAG TPA: NAD(P)/FAD-dependent oxidoreductase [Polyangiaceae bacterium]